MSWSWSLAWLQNEPLSLYKTKRQTLLALILN